MQIKFGDLPHYDRLANQHAGLRAHRFCPRGNHDVGFRADVEIDGMPRLIDPRLGELRLKLTRDVSDRHDIEIYLSAVTG